MQGSTVNGQVAGWEAAELSLPLHESRKAGFEPFLWFLVVTYQRGTSWTCSSAPCCVLLTDHDCVWTLMKVL